MAKLIDFPLGISPGETRLDLNPDTTHAAQRGQLFQRQSQSQ